MPSRLVTPCSIRCGHLNDIDQKKCSLDERCQLGVQPVQIITETCKRCLQDKTFRSEFRDLRDKESLFRYWEGRKLSKDRNFWGPFRLGVGVSRSYFRNITAEMETGMLETWQEEIRRIVKLASCGVSAVFMEGQGWYSVKELDSVKGRALLERAMEMILEQTNKTK